MTSPDQNAFWLGKKVFITGHTGFKGGWLASWLLKLGAKVYGCALEPTSPPNLFQAIGLENHMQNMIQDIRDLAGLSKHMREANPDIVFHLAAQPLVIDSYERPLETYQTNVMGTCNVLEVCRRLDTVRVVVVVTSDKCYENKEWPWSYRESDSLGGHDPYSSSKACAEIVTSSFRSSFYSQSHKPDVAIITARAGNVFGGGDWSQNRLIPDIVRAISNKHTLNIRNPRSKRPWQFVLEPLRGYLMLAEKAFADPKTYSCPWNFGPREDDVVDVRTVATQFTDNWGAEGHLNIENNTANAVHEAFTLKLDSSQAMSVLGWRRKVLLQEGLALTCQWYQEFFASKNPKQLLDFTQKQITTSGQDFRE